MRKKERQQIGQLLVNSDVIQDDVLEQALERQKETGCRLGDILLADGSINALEFYSALAQQSGLEFWDLTKIDIDELLLDEDRKDDYLRLKAIPVKQQDGKIIIATSDPSIEVEEWAEKIYKQYSFVMTSRYDIVHAVNSFFEGAIDEQACNALWNYDNRLSARSKVSKPVMRLIAWGFIVLLALMLLKFNLFLSAFFIAVNLFFALTLFSKAVFFFFGMWRNRVKDVDDSWQDVSESGLPKYTILLPLYHEKGQTIKQLKDAIMALDYPKSKLDIKLIIEGNDLETRENVLNQKFPANFRIVQVPFSLPQTKPKACNYALQFAEGEFVTIYDAEDIPDSNQLKRVVSTFRKKDKNLACVQCRLNYYNYQENALTRMFALEYASWFNFMLPGLQGLHIPIPLGGTSNHFRTSILQKLKAWDAYNVTEDADLGLRIALEGYDTCVLNSTTMEESPIYIGAWMRQRSRWIKGYMQTFIVHMRRVKNLVQYFGIKGFIGFIFFVGAPAMIFILMPVVLVLSLVGMYFDNLMPSWFVWVALWNFWVGLVLHWVIGIAVCFERRWWRMLPFCILFPFYWILHSLASFKAFYQLLMKPYYWEKTEHGLSKSFIIF